MTDEERLERRRESKRKWAAANKDKIREKNKRWAANNKEVKLERQRKYRVANREKVNAYARELSRKEWTEHPEKMREKENRRYLKSRKDNPEWHARQMDNQRKRNGRVDSGRRKGVVMPSEIRYARTRQTQRNARLKKEYGITLEEFNAMVENQNGCCAICSKHYSENFMRALCVDHDHKTGKVRGLLCRHCNAALGNFDDDIQLLRKAIAYLHS